jgi:hypothetical protein
MGAEMFALALSLSSSLETLIMEGLVAILMSGVD